MLNRILVCLLLVSLSACSDPVKEELTKYINIDIPIVAAMENELTASHTTARLAAQQGAEDEAIIESWGIALAKCRIHEEGVSAISVKLQTPEVRELHEILIEAANKICTGMVAQLDALYKDDLNLVNQANAQLNDAKKSQRKWQSQLEMLKKAHKITTSLTSTKVGLQKQLPDPIKVKTNNAALNDKSNLPTGIELARSSIRISPMQGEKSLSVEGGNVTGSCGNSIIRILGITKAFDNVYITDSDGGKIIIRASASKELTISPSDGVLSDFNGMACVSSKTGESLLIWSNCSGSACGDNYHFYVIDPNRLTYLAPKKPQNKLCDAECASLVIGSNLPQEINSGL